MAETQEQKAFIEHFKDNWPQYERSLRVSMAGLPRYGKKGAVMWGMMKSQGVIAGEADIVLLLPRGEFPYLVIEHKGEGQPHKVTEDQQAYLDYHAGLGACTTSTRGLGALQAAVEAYIDGRWVRSENGVLYCAEAS